MGLFETIRRLVAEGSYLVGQHAAERLEERGVLEWQAVAGLADGRLLREDEEAEPNPAVLVLEQLPDGGEFRAVWSFLREADAAKLVTVFFVDR